MSEIAAPAETVRSTMERNFIRRAKDELNFHNNAHDGILYTDKDNKVVYANPYFMEMMDIADEAELMNQPLPEYMWGSQPQQAEGLFQDVRVNGFVRERELALFNRRNEPVFAMCSSVASYDDEGNYIGTEIMLCNITSKRKIQKELVDRNRQLERVTAFASTMLENLREIVQRNASRNEIERMLNDLQNELGKL